MNLKQKLARQSHCQACDADLTGSDMAPMAEEFWPYCSPEHRDEYEGNAADDFRRLVNPVMGRESSWSTSPAAAPDARPRPGNEVSGEFRAATAEFMDRNDELLRRLADG